MPLPVVLKEAYPVPQVLILLPQLGKLHTHSLLRAQQKSIGHADAYTQRTTLYSCGGHEAHNYQGPAHLQGLLGKLATLPRLQVCQEAGQRGGAPSFCIAYSSHHLLHHLKAARTALQGLFECR